MSDCQWKDNFRRHYELFLSSDRSHPDNYFSVPSVRQALENCSPKIQSMEEKFQQINPKAWSQFVDKARPYLIAKDQWGCHSQLWQLFNELQGYLYLEGMGYADIEFIEEQQGQKTPDLRGTNERGNAVLEVKTIRESDASYNYLHSNDPSKGAVKSTQTIPKEFKDKIRETIENGVEQLNSEPNQGNIKKFLLIIFCPDIDSHSSTVISQVRKLVYDSSEKYQGMAIEFQTDSAYPIHPY
jgi:hypothetical protein